jgi:hypothetical protein
LNAERFSLVAKRPYAACLMPTAACQPATYMSLSQNSTSKREQQ